jgi:hypothetical protein
MSISGPSDRLQDERSHHSNLEAIMKCICLGYYDEKQWEAISELEWVGRLRACLAYDEALRTNGHLVGGGGLQIARDAATLRWQNGKLSVTEGPFVQTREQLGGIMMLEADDLGHAVRLMSKHPGIRLGGCFEIRPTDDFRPGSQEIHVPEEQTPCSQLTECENLDEAASIAVRIPMLPVGGGVKAPAAVPA